MKEDLKFKAGKWYVCTRKLRYGSCMFFTGVMYLCAADNELTDTTGEKTEFSEKFHSDGYMASDHFRPATPNESLAYEDDGLVEEANDYKQHPLDQVLEEGGCQPVYNGAWSEELKRLVDKCYQMAVRDHQTSERGSATFDAARLCAFIFGYIRKALEEY